MRRGVVVSGNAPARADVGGETSRYTLASEWQRNSSSSLTQAGAYAIRYRLALFSNFTYFLDYPANGDQFEQADDRLVAGMRGSHRWLARWGRVTMENLAGVQARHDDIRNVGSPPHPYARRARPRASCRRRVRCRSTRCWWGRAEGKVAPLTRPSGTLSPPPAGIDDLHFHPVETRAFRVGVTTSF